MIEARFDPKDYKDWLGLVAELEAQGIKFDWSSSGVPTYTSPVTQVYDPLNHTFFVRQKS